MSATLFSQSWYRVAPLKPRLRSHVQIHRHVYRDQDWYVLQDNFTGRHHRFSPEAYQVIGLLDGKRSLGDIWDVACARLGDHMPTQDEVIALLAQLHRGDLLQSGTLPDFADLQQRRSQQRRSRSLQNLRSPMSIRFPLFDPERLLEQTMPLVRPWLGWLGALLWVLVVAVAAGLAVIHWPELTENISDQILSLQNLLLIGLVYPVVKVIHEFGHAYMVKRWGGEVHEMGVMLLVLMPIPYVDASSSLSFRDKRQRMLVAGAGILVELFLAGLAMLVWVNVEPGAVRAVAFNTMLIAGVSTLLFNGNPLLRFDAYYVLADYLEIPNLGARASSYIGYLLQKHLLGLEQSESPAQTRGEAVWLGVYAVAAFIYRIFISVRIILFVAGKFFFVGILLACWAGVSMLITPLLKVGRFLVKDPRMQRKKPRLVGAVLLPLLMLVAATLWLPLPSYTLSEGVTWAPEESKVYAAADGFVSEILVASGNRVVAGTPLLRCSDPELQAEVAILQARLKEFRSRYQLRRLENLTEADILKDEIERIKAELARAQERQADLHVLSSGSGIFVQSGQEDWLGRYVKRGTPIGYLLDEEKMQVRVLVTQADFERVRSQLRKVTVRLAENLDQELSATIVRQVPSATRELPSLALSLEGGGRFALDPAQKERLQVFERLFQLDIEVSQPLIDKIEERVYVRFEHEPEPLASRWYRGLRRLLLSRFDV